VDPDRDTRPLMLTVAGIVCAALVPVLQSLWLALPALGFVIWAYVDRRILLRRFRRHFRGQCLKCGYDLRATPDCCPECGAAREAP
jgi:hypothetical protein